MEEWNDTARPLVPATLPELFAAQAERTPDAVAVVFEDSSLSYAALDRQANQLRIGCAVWRRTESVVGLCLNRSLEMIVDVFGILKAGATICHSIRTTRPNGFASCCRILMPAFCLRVQRCVGSLVNIMFRSCALMPNRPSSPPSLPARPQSRFTRSIRLCDLHLRIDRTP